MLPAERKRRIVELVTERNGCSVADLASELDFSKATIRRDLQDLENEGRVERSHGGAVPVSTVGQDRSFDEREVDRLEAKRAIGTRAAEELREEQVAFFDAGTTTMGVARAVPDGHDLTAVTNMPDLASVLLDRGIEVTLTGGRLRERTRALVGPVAEDYLADRHVDVLFLGTNGLDADAGLTTPDQDEGAVKARMIDGATRVVLVADGSKFGEQHFVTFGALDDVDVLVTDTAPPPDLAEALDAAAVSVAEVSP